MMTKWTQQAGVSSRDLLFIGFVKWLIIIMILYGTGMVTVVLFGDALLASRLVSGFATMFAGLLGLGSGYLLARRDDNGKEGHG